MGQWDNGEYREHRLSTFPVRPRPSPYPPITTRSRRLFSVSNTTRAFFPHNWGGGGEREMGEKRKTKESLPLLADVCPAAAVFSSSRRISFILPHLAVSSSRDRFKIGSIVRCLRLPYTPNNLRVYVAIARVI